MMDDLNISCDVTPVAETPITTLVDFLKAFHPEGPWCLTALGLEKNDAAVTTTFFPATEDGARAFIDRWNGKRNLYFAVNPVREATNKKAKATDVAALAYLHVDIDPRVGEDLDAERKRIVRLLSEGLPVGVPKPTVIVFSGGGYQAFWKLAEPLKLDGTHDQAEAAKLYNLQLERIFEADSCHNIDRIMRLPFTLNLPNAKKKAKGRVPTMATLVEADFSRVYPLETFKKAASRDGSVASGTQPDLVPVIDVDLSGGDVVLEDVYALDAFTADGQPLEDRVKRIIQNGCDDLDDKLDGKPKDDRSRWVFDATCALVRRGVPDNIILSVLLDPDFKISAHVHDQKSGARKYAIRQIKRAKERVALSAAEFHTDDKGKPFIKSQHNIRVALAKLGVTVKLDVFRNRMIAEGLDDQTLDVDDSMVRRLWLESDQRFRFMPTKEFFFEVLANEARTNSFHPVREYLDSLTWDGTPRLNTWLSTYAGAKDSEFIQSISLIILIAAVRRVRQPGCKFDQMLVLEGSQGIGKSSLVRTLAVRDEWFADEAPLGGDGKAAIEMLSGKWLIEPAELKSLKNSEAEHVKAFLSRQTDRGREAYGRIVSEVPRQCIFIGTTNSDRYLMDPTGNRRFWPVKLDYIDVEALKRDREQLWAEAAYLEAKGESIQLADDLWAQAATEQGARVIDDPFLMDLQRLLGTVEGKILKSDVYRLLELPVGQRHSGHQRRIAEAMRTLGWRDSKMRHQGGNPQHCFINCDETEARWIEVSEELNGDINIDMGPENGLQLRLVQG